MVGVQAYGDEILPKPIAVMRDRREIVDSDPIVRTPVLARIMGVAIFASDVRRAPGGGRTIIVG